MKDIRIRDEKVIEQMEELMRIYNLKTHSKLIKHIVELDYNKHFKNT